MGRTQLWWCTVSQISVYFSCTERQRGGRPDCKWRGSTMMEGAVGRKRRELLPDGQQHKLGRWLHVKKREYKRAKGVRQTWLCCAALCWSTQWSRLCRPLWFPCVRLTLTQTTSRSSPAALSTPLTIYVSVPLSSFKHWGSQRWTVADSFFTWIRKLKKKKVLVEKVWQSVWSKFPKMGQ